jgi:hypothetical protein
MDEKDDKRGRKKESLFDKALKAYGITSGHVLGDSVEHDGAVTFVTTGGRKITFQDGDQPARIPWPMLTGEPPEMERGGLTAGKKQK